MTSTSSMAPPQKRPTVVLCVTGSIAAFKAVEIARHLIQGGVRVLPVFTRSGGKFIGKATLNGICGQVVRDDMWDESFSGELHVHLATEADVVLVAPATADVIARFATGRADDLVAAVVLCAKGPVVVAPAMHPRMWAHPATQRNVRTIKEDGRVQFVGPVVGPVATGEVGLGRMAEPSDIAQAVLSVLAKKDLQGRHVVVSAGPTVEDIDPVRFLSNRSTGRMGFAVAQRAQERGAKVTLVSGPSTIPTPYAVERIDVRGALQMREALQGALADADALIMTSAVSDYRVAKPSEYKRKREAEKVALELVANPDLLAEIGASRTGSKPILVGFAVESDEAKLVDYARDKLLKKKVDFVVGNTAKDGFAGDTNRAVIVDNTHAQWTDLMSKYSLADCILDRVRDALEKQES
jgi:phosphopantothenoylcysteine decarboxylase/phosphopantothenate--cysteine ligase